MTVIRPNSISGITSLTAHRGSIDFYAHDGSAARFDNINSNVTSGVSTFASLNITGDLDVGGALTYEDVTNIDSVGVITARNGIDVTGGSVGIGTDNPSKPLQVHDDSASAVLITGTTPQIRLNSNVADSSDDNRAIFGLATGNNHFVSGSVSGDTVIRTTNGGNLIFGEGTAGRLRITSAGNVAIGHNSAPTKLGIRGTSASTDATVQIVGNGVSTLLLGQDAAGGVIRGQGGSNQLKFKVGGSGDDAAATGGVEALRIDSSGRLMLGQTSAYSATGTGTMMLTVTKNASNRTDVAISNQFSGDNASAALVLATHGQDYILEATGSGNTTDGVRAFRILKGSDERLRITSDGQMILGTASNLGSVPPKLTIVNNTNSSTFSECQLLRLNGPSGVGERGGIGFHYAQSLDYGEKPSSFIGVETVAAGGAQQTDLLFATRPNTNDSEPTERLRITSDGKMGVGCTPETDFQVRNANGGTVKIGGSGNSATGFQIQYNNSGNTTTELLTNYRSTSSNASLKLDTGTLKIATGTSGTDQLIIDSNGRILKGMSASLLGSSDVQLTGSGGPATVAGYKSDNNPTANTSMLTVTGYSQSGGTFTGIGEIDFRVDQGSNTASGYHPGSIVTRVNSGSTTGTHAGHTYSYAGLKDRERIAFKSKRYYPLPEWGSGSDTYNTFREEWDYQHIVGYNQYSWYRFTSHSSSSSRGGSVDIRVTWSSRHAGGNGYGHWAFHWRDNHSNGYMAIGNVYRYHLNYLNGSYYGWTSNPALDVYEINDSGNNGGFYLRVQGHVDANSSTYDGGIIQQFTISAHTNRLGADVNKFEFVGNSTPSDVGSIQGNVNLP